MPVEAGTFTFLQVSDAHLDSKLSSLRLALPPAKRHDRNEEILQVLLKSFSLARERNLDAVLIAGDLWDSESITGTTLNRLMEAAGDLGNLPVVIAPGNHDYCAAESPYNRNFLKVRGMRQWPGNVHIFSQPEFTTWSHPAISQVSITGRAFVANVPVTERLLTAPVPKGSDALVNILLFHGSLDNYKGRDNAWPGKTTAPFSATELEKQGFNYTAVGHYHHHTEIVSTSGTLLGAYSGCLAGRGADECGPRYVLIGTIPLQPGAVCTLEPIELDSRRIVQITCDVTGSTSAEVVKDIQQLLSDAGARTGTDIVCIALEGRHPIGGEPTYVADSFRDSYYHVAVSDQSRPDYLTDRFDRRTTEGRFIHALTEMKREALESGGYLVDNSYDCELTPELIEDALYYGLDALKQKKVTVRYVD